MISKPRSARSSRRWAPGSTPPATWRCSPTRAVPTTTWPPTSASVGCCEPAPVIELGQELARASAMLDVKRFDEASALLSHIVAAEPESSRAWCLMARAHLGADRYAEAIEVANRAVALDPSDEWPHRLASNALVHLGNYSDALRAAHEACRLAPSYWQTHVCLA